MSAIKGWWIPEECLWGFENHVPMRAVYKDGKSEPVVGFAAVKSPLEPGREDRGDVTTMVGISVGDKNLTFCEACDGFIRYASTVEEANDIYQKWVRENQEEAIEYRMRSGNMENPSYNKMEVIRTENDLNWQADNELGEVADADRGNDDPASE